MIVSSEVRERLGIDAETAIAQGALERTKVQNRWLYFHPDGADVVETLEIAWQAAEEVLAEWLLNPVRFLVGQTIRAAEPHDISHAAMKLLLQELCARHRLDGLGLMSQSLQPYLAFFSIFDRDEIERQVQAMRSLLLQNRRVEWRELPEPARAVPRRVWRETVLAHGAWLGIGHQPERGILEAW